MRYLTKQTAPSEVRYYQAKEGQENVTQITFYVIYIEEANEEIG